MLEVDPTIEIGAVGVAPIDAWGDFGNEVLRAAGNAIDFYVVHDYGFDRSPSVEAAVARPGETWPELLGGLDAVDGLGSGPDEAPIAITEYNLVSFQDGDERARMNQAVNAFYLTDTIGRLAAAGVPIANQWNVMNGSPDNGTDYGLLDAATGEANPSYVASLLWRRMLGELIVSDTDGDEIQLYATRDDDGVVNVLVLNSAAVPNTLEIAVTGGPTQFDVVADVVIARDLESADVTFNGVSVAAGGFVDAPAEQRGVLDATARHTFEPFSITRLRLAPA
jgi:hypothetical protein